MSVPLASAGLTALSDSEHEGVVADIGLPQLSSAVTVRLKLEFIVHVVG